MENGEPHISGLVSAPLTGNPAILLSGVTSMGELPRGVLVVGEVIRTRMAIQVKRWKPSNRVQAPEVQKVRGSLGTHEQGLIVTTSDFSTGARDEAARANAVPVALMNGEQLVALLAAYGIGVSKQTHDIIDLGEDDPGDKHPV
jgi:restriction system protein